LMAMAPLSGLLGVAYHQLVRRDDLLARMR
jgi:cytochrome b561